MDRDLIRQDTSFAPSDKIAFATQLGITLYIVVTFIYLGFGLVNADEGWYLDASKLVFQGALPYRDFAYTQMPLLPYIYGLSQALGPSIVWGRLTSILISFGTLGMSLIIARRYGGTRAAAITSLLMAAFTFGVYFNSIVKTYAFVSFCLTATLFVLSSNLNDRVKYPLALLYALCAALVRLTAVFFAVPVLLYILVAAPRRQRALALFEAAAASLLAGLFLLTDWPSASWGLLGSHLSHWGDARFWEQILDIVSARLPETVQAFGPLLLLGAIALYFLLVHRGRQPWPHPPAPLLAVLVGLGLFAVSHLANGQWQVEYLVPAVTAMIPIIAIGLGRFYERSDSSARSLIQVLLVAVLVLLPLGESNQHVKYDNGVLPMMEIRDVAAFVAQNSQPDDKVLALEALNVAVEARRDVLPGMTLAQFSVQGVDTPTAQQLHVVNYELVQQAISQKTAHVILFTDGDLYNLAVTNPSDPAALQAPLAQNYQQALVVPNFGQFGSTLYVYTSR